MITPTDNAVAAVKHTDEAYSKIRSRRMSPGLYTSVAASQQEATGPKPIRNG